MTGTADDELAFAGPGALAELVRTREVHPRELVELCLSRIEALDPRVNAFRAVMAEQALAQADAQPTGGALAGVPFAVKDEMPWAGQVATWGSRTHGPPAHRDAEVVRRLRGAGAIPIGITNVPELMIFPWTASDAHGITRNPWDLSRTPGGSSGGSAAAVAAGMVPAALAADGGGSIRIPAACCGLVGMKPTRGTVSLQPACEGWLGLTVYGALARSVTDSALLLDVLQGGCQGGPDVVSLPAGRCVEAVSRPPGRLRIAISRKVPAGVLTRVSAEQRGAWERTGRLLSKLGHEVVERDPDYGLVSLEFTQTFLRAVYEQACRVPDRSQLERSTRQLSTAGAVLVSSRRRDRLRAARAGTSARILALWNDVDVLLTPSLAATAIAAEGGYGRAAPIALDLAARFTPWTPVFNLTGQPAVALPAGFSAAGLPLSVQLVGRLGAEEMLYSLAGQLERARPWGDRRPSIASAA
ncbi:MAG: amidase family protein [Solirubrobacteraceae bacterium]